MSTNQPADIAGPQNAGESLTEPKVLTEDVRRVLCRVVHPDDDDVCDSVTLVAERAQTSTRTIYRLLSLSTPTVNLDLADRVCIASGGHLMDCHLVWPDGRITNYFD